MLSNQQGETKPPRALSTQTLHCMRHKSVSQTTLDLLVHYTTVSKINSFNKVDEKGNLDAGTGENLYL